MSRLTPPEAPHRRLAEKGHEQAAIEQVLRAVTLEPALRAELQAAATTTVNARLHIVSDANTVFIAEILQANDLTAVFGDRIFTNPGRFDNVQELHFFLACGLDRWCTLSCCCCDDDANDDDDVCHATKTSELASSAGMGWGKVRSGIDAVHRVEVDCPEFLKEPKTCAIVGAPFTYGQPRYGVDNGPEALRDAGLMEALLRLGWRAYEHGDITFESPARGNPRYEGPGSCKHPYVVGEANRQIAEVCEEHAREGRFVLTLGGDHSIGVGTIAGQLLVRPETGVIWVDAHADINTPALSGSGNMHGMPLAFLSRLVAPEEVPGFDWLKRVPALDPSTQLVYIGLRDVDKPERDIIRQHNIKAFTMSHVDKFGIGKVMEMALDHLGERPLHLSYDIDACDPAIAPSTGTAVRGGLTYREAHYVAEAANETHRLASMDLVEVNPTFNGEM
ncbi:uncharacterized protein MONBRDRAFT_37086, partial [Monosiga brevicollis MX1]